MLSFEISYSENRLPGPSAVRPPAGYGGADGGSPCVSTGKSSTRPGRISFPTCATPRATSAATCYSYHSDLGIWAAWLAEAGKDWQRVKAQDVEQFAAWRLREKGSDHPAAAERKAQNRISVRAKMRQLAQNHQKTTRKCLQTVLGVAMVLAIQSVALTNELADPGLEKTVADRLAAWTPYGRGYALDATEVQSGRLAVRCETRGDQDGMGIAQVIHYDRPDKRPIIVGGWSKAEDVGSGGDYCLYLDILYDDGTPWWGKTAAWTRGSHGWQYTAEVYQPEKPVRQIQAFVFLRRTKGKAWFDNVFIHRGGLHATQVRVMSDFPRRPNGQRIRPAD